MKTPAGDLKGAFGRLRKKMRSVTSREHAERRSSKRAELRIPIQVRVGNSPPFSTRLHDISPNGLCFEGGDKGSPDDPVSVRFEGYPGVCESFVLVAKLARRVAGKPARTAVRITREQNRPQALAEYRKLVLHYLRHRPLLEEKSTRFVEGRCTTCDWVGRVGVRNPVCSRCGLPIKILID
jgi:hypothetical protein